MSEPKNPETIIVQNNFYPNGLKEIDIWNYYKKNKILLLNETRGRELIFFLGIDKNKTIVKRNTKDGSLIFLNDSNFDQYITGRTLSIHSCMRKAEEFGIIDIDTDNFFKAKEAAYDVINTMDRAPFVRDVKVRFTGKESFHIVCYFKRKLYMDHARILLRNFLKESYLSKIYDIEYMQKGERVNLDLAPNKYRGGYITLGSLSTLGLRCMEVNLRFIKSFNKQMAVIPTKK